MAMALGGKVAVRGERSMAQRPSLKLRSRTALLPSPSRVSRPLRRFALNSTANETQVEVEDAEKEESVQEPEQKKYYRTMPGFPNVMLEFDEPEVDTKPKGKFVWWKFLLLCGGVVLMFAEVTTFAMVAMR